MSLTRPLLLLLACVSISVGAKADMFSNIGAEMSMNSLQNELMQRQLDEEEEGRASPPVNEAGALTYSPTRSVHEEVFGAFIEVTEQSDPATAENLRNLIAAQPDAFEEVKDAVRSYDLDPDNIADTYALWWMSAWMAANGVHDAPDGATMAAVKKQTRDSFLATPGVDDLSDAQKQKFAEALLLQTLVVDTSMDRARGDAALEAQVAEAARTGAMQGGVDLSAMKLTQNGFEPR